MADSLFTNDTPKGTRSFTDYDTTRQNIYDGVFSGLKERYPIENSRYRLELHDPKFTGPESFSLKDEKDAILRRRSLTRRLQGTWKLVNKADEQVVDEKSTTLGNVPYLTRRGTYIVGGSEYTVANQMRLRPGIYTRKKDNGEYEAHFNIFKGGRSFRTFMEPDTGVFRMQLGQSRLKMYPIMKAMGITDKQMRETWGEGVWLANRTDTVDKATLRKAYDRLASTRVKKESGEEDGATADFAKLFAGLELDPEVTTRTLGVPHKSVTPAAVMDTTRKLLRISRGEADPDDRDALAFQTINSAEDFIKERLVKDAGQQAHRALWKATFWGNLKKLQAGLLDPQIESLFYKSGLAQPLEEINPIDALDQNLRVTRMGEGGIPSRDAVPDECYDDETEVFTAKGWVAWPEVEITDQLACLQGGRLGFAAPYGLVAKPYSGDMYQVRTRTLDIKVTPTHRHWVRKYRGGSSKKRVGEADWGFELAAETHRKPRQFKIACEAYRGQRAREDYSLPCVGGARKKYTFKLLDFAELLGWYISEGGLDSYARRVRHKWHLTISQNDGEAADRIGALLSRMGIAHSRQGHNYVFVSKQIGVYFEACGSSSPEKRIPAEAFTWPAAVRQRLYEALVDGDGSRKENGLVTYTTSSAQLVTDFVRLCTTLGLPARVRKPDERHPEGYTPRFSIGVLSSVVQGVTSARQYDKDYFICKYEGMVYCARIPGEKLLVRRHGSVPVWSGNSRNVQPSHFMFIDPIRSPESGSVGVDSRVAVGTLKGADNRFYTRVLDARTGQEKHMTPQDLTESAIAFPGEMAKAKAKGLKKVRVMRGGRLAFADVSEVDYEAPTSQELFTVGSNLVPLVSAIKGGRLLMGAKMAPQALPLRNAEAPLVQSAMPSGRSFEQEMGRHTEAVFAEVPGVVKSVDADSMTVTGLDGQDKAYELYNNFPMNRKTFLHSTPNVKVGDLVSKGQPLAKGNFTDKEGRLALGTNLRVAYMPFRGLNYEDAVVVSQAGADKLESEHMYTEKMDTVRGVKPDRNAYVSVFPSVYKRAQVDSIGDDGVVKPGTVVQRDDPLILAVERRARKGSGVLSRAGGPRFSDASVTWDHDFPGEVTDVYSDKGGIKVAVKAYAPAQVGDKLCMLPDTEVLTTDGWKLVGDLILADCVCCLDPKTHTIVYDNPEYVYTYDHDGPIYYLESQLLDLAVTLNHKLYVQRRPRKNGLKRVFELMTAEEAKGKRLRHKCDGVWYGTGVDTIELPGASRRRGSHGTRLFDSVRVPAAPFMALVGWYLLEGCLEGKSDVQISQCCKRNPEKCASIGRVLDACGLEYSYSGHAFRVYSPQLYDWIVSNCPGLAADKRIPRQLLELCVELLCELYDSLMAGDGSISATSKAYHSISKGLCDDVQELVLKLGMAGRVGVWRVAGDYEVKGKVQHRQTAYCTYIRDKKLTPQVNHGHVHEQHVQTEEVRPYLGKVHGCTVPTGIIYVRRNGKAVWSGNSGRYGNKGVIGGIIPNDEMPRDEQGKPMDILLNPLGVISRVNPSQLHEAILGKIARMRGKPYVVSGFSEDDLTDLVEAEMKKYGVKDTESVVDPKMERKIPGVFTGEAFFHKLHHTAESKSSGRGIGSYTIEGEPAGGENADNPKRVGMGELASLISHGAVANIRDIKTIRGQRNDDYWNAIIQGYSPPSPGIPNMYKKFLSSLQAAGVNVKKEGNYLHLMAMTDKDVNKMSTGAIKSADTVKWKSQYGREAFGEKSMEPVPGGLFDLKLTGGHGGKKWSHIDLSKPMPQPVMEEPIRRLLNLTKPKFNDVLAGKHELPGLGTGPEAIGRALSAVNVDRDIQSELEAIKTAPSVSRRDAAVKRLKYLKGLKDTGVKPSELMINKVPVLPPIFRPITATEKFDMVAGVNLLYKDLMDADGNLKNVGDVMEGEPVGDAQLNVYNALKAVTGLGDPIKAERKQQRVKGLLKQVFGCYDDKTEILTRQGWVPFPEYYEGDVATLNPGTRAFEWQTPTQVHHYRYQGEMTALTYRNSIDLMLTPRHENWVLRRGGRWKKEKAWRTAASSGRAWMVTSASDWKGHKDVPSFVSCDAKVFARFVGWWLAEGYFHQDGGVELDQVTRNKKGCLEIAEIVGALGLDVRVGTYLPSVRGKGYSNRRHWSIKSKELEQWLREHAGYRSEGKRLSTYIKGWDKDILIELLQGYLSGEGEKSSVHLKEGGRTHRRVDFLEQYSRFTTVSEQLVSDLQELGLKVGITIRLNKLQSPKKENWQQQYRGTLYGDSLAPWEGCIGEFVPYDGYVHCVTVPNGLVFVRRNGKPIVSGNSSPKLGIFQRKLLGSSVDVAGRATITPNPSLDMDHIGVPEDQAWKLYGPFAVRNLVRRFGNKPEMRAAAVRMVTERKGPAREALLEEMKTRPVLATRAPALHRYSIMAFYPTITKGHTLQLSPSVTPGFNADFDGDAMNFHVVVGDEAVQEAKSKMLPSKNLRSASDFGTMWGPKQEFLQGLYAATGQRSDKAPRVFNKREDVVRAFNEGKIDVDDPVVIMH